MQLKNAELKLFLTVDRAIAENLLNPCPTVTVQALLSLLQGVLYMAENCATQTRSPFCHVEQSGSERVQFRISLTY